VSRDGEDCERGRSQVAAYSGALVEQVDGCVDGRTAEAALITAFRRESRATHRRRRSSKRGKLLSGRVEILRPSSAYHL